MRSRNLKPSLFKNELLGAADPLLTILFEGLWCEADREGRLEDRPLRIKGEVFPYRDGLNIEPLLEWLQANGFILRYTVDDLKIIQVVKFLEHQHPHKNEVPSVLPPPPVSRPTKARRTSNQGTKSDGPSTKPLGLIPSSLIPDSLSLIPESPCSPPEASPSSATPTRQPWVQEVFEHWQREWGHPEAKLDDKRRKRISARLKDFTVDQLCHAISGFKHSAWHCGTDPKGDGKVYDGLQTLLRDNAQVEEGMRLFRNPPKQPEQPRPLSTVERVRQANGVHRDDRVVAEQRNGPSFDDLDLAGGDVREPLHAGIRRLGS